MANTRILALPPVQFTAMVNCGDILPGERVFHLTRGAKRKEKTVSEEDSSVRATISFPPDMYKTLEEIARQKKVSLAWVVREAADQYISDKWPLFKGKV
jgi:ribbon-helix-helix CopG family protein